MYKLNLGVGSSILKLVYLPYNEKTFIMDLIKQHKIILSEKIISYYIEMAGEQNAEIVETFIDSLVYTNDSHVFYETDNDDSAQKEIVDLVKRNPMKVLISEVEEFEGIITNKIKLISSKNILNKEDNVFLKYSFPIVNYIIGSDSNCESVATWFGHLFENEEQIQILDKFIMTENGIRVLKKYYFPKIQYKTKVEIYCECLDGYTDEMIKNIMEDTYFQSWDIQVYICNGMHDRYIQFGHYQISIGAGLDFLHCSGNTKKSCTINITCGDKKIPLPNVERMLL